MTHAIYIYFIINAFIAGYMHRDLDDLKYTITWFFTGCLFPIFIFGKWLDKELEITSIIMFLFTNKWGNLTDKEIVFLRNVYNSVHLSRYRKWVLRQIDKKYGYGITKGDSKP